MPVFSPTRSMSMSQSKSHPHRDNSLGRVAIFWDYESCRPTSFSPAYTIVDNIRDACLPYGSITSFRAYVEKADAYVSTPPTRPVHFAHPSLREQLQLYGVSLSYYSPSTRALGERQLLVDMMLFALDNPAPSTVLILITAEELSPYAISALRLRHYKVVLITPQNNGNPSRPAMAVHANEVIDWTTVMNRGRRSPGEGHSSPGSVNSVLSLPVSPTDRRPTPGDTVSSGGTVVDAPVAPPLSRHSSSNSQSAHSQHQHQHQQQQSLSNPTPLFPPVISQHTAIPFQPFRAGTFTPRSQPGLNRVWGNPFPSSNTLFPPPLNTNTTSNAPNHGPPSSISSSTSSLTSPTSNWTQSPPTSQAHLFGPVGGQLSPTDSIVRRPTQYQPSESRITQHNFQILPSSAQRESPIPMNSNYGPPQTHRSPPPTSHHQQQQQQQQQHQVQLPSQYSQHSQRSQSHSSTPNFQFGHGLQQSSMYGLQSQQLPPPPPVDPRHFELLINILADFRNEGKPRPYRSKIGSELVSRDRLVYQRAGVTGFKDYVGYAEQMGIVKLGGHSGSPGKEWIELIVSE